MNIIDKTYKQAVLNSNENRKALAEKKLDYYFNESYKILLNLLDKCYKEKAESVLPCFLNVVTKIVNLKACVYLSDAVRTIDGTATDKAIYSDFEDSASLPIVMKQANRLCNLCGVVFMRVVFRNGSMQVDLITPDVIDVILGDSPQDIQAVVITHFAENGKSEEKTYTKWTAETIIKLDYNFKLISEEENPYKVIPFVPLHVSLPINDFWQDGTACDLIAVQETINVHLSSLFHTLFYQGHATGYVKGAEHDSSQELAFGAGSMVFLPENGEIGFTSPQANISEAVLAITFLIEQLAVQNGLPASVVSTKTTEASGISLVVQSGELAELRRDQIALFAKAEQQLFKLFKIIWNIHNPQNKISETSSLRVDFAEIQQSMTQLDKFTLFQKEYNMGLASCVDYLMEKNPDYSRDEAFEKIVETTAENQRIAKTTPELNPTQKNTLSTSSNSLLEKLNTL